jgi:poly-gamma-glutamate capsule biosynthesis protein CapA/YwtB (metallophosphatase superfamily)
LPGSPKQKSHVRYLRTSVRYFTRTSVRVKSFKCTNFGPRVRTICPVTGPRRSFIFLACLFASTLLLAAVAATPTYKSSFAMVLAQSATRDASADGTSAARPPIETSLPQTPQTSQTPQPPTPQTKWTLAFGGDTLYTRPLSRITPARNPFARIRPEFASSDITILNLETALTSRGRAQAKTFTFRSPPGFARVIQDAGVDIVSLANNHTLDFGVVGLEDTLATIDDIGLRRVGAGRTLQEALEPVIVEQGDVRVAVLGASQIIPAASWVASSDRPGIASAGKHVLDRNTINVIEAVRASRTRADVVVVVLHWGIEGSVCPSPIQRKLAKALHDAGAAVVLGAHPHVLQPIEQTGTNLTAFSLGNFIWDPRSGSTADTGVLQVEFAGAAIAGFTFHPHRLDGNGWAAETAPTGRLGERVIARTTRRCT